MACSASTSPTAADSTHSIIEDEGVYVPVIYKECRVDLDIDNPTIHPLSGPCMEPCCYSTPELAIKAGTRIYRNMLKDNK